MTRKHSYKLALGLIICITAAGCGSGKIRQARKAAFRIQVVTDAAVDTTVILYHDGVIDREYGNKIARILFKVNSGNRVLLDEAEAAKADTPEVRAGLLAQLKVIEDAVKELKEAGVLGIKSANGELAYESAINALDAAIAVIQAALAGGKQ